MTLIAQYLVTGIVTGCFLILATIGFSLTRRVEGFLNIAHAEMLGVSAFIAWGLNTQVLALHTRSHCRDRCDRLYRPLHWETRL
ncbi:hypothetical protein ACFQFQ_31695 [Sulfitobacter porphyrae]|uniref:Branched-chain amino acid transport system / permease component n=1 Tax=Sulfitobacter porphyrae TaxID=1246864 RepID=A0ABW2BD62_9RHOB